MPCILAGALTEEATSAEERFAQLAALVNSAGGRDCATPSSSRGRPEDCFPGEAQVARMVRLDRVFGAAVDAARMAANHPTLCGDDDDAGGGGLSAEALAALAARVRAAVGPLGGDMSVLLEIHAGEIASKEAAMKGDTGSALLSLSSAHPGLFSAATLRRLRARNPSTDRQIDVAAVIAAVGAQAAPRADDEDEASEDGLSGGASERGSRAPRAQRERKFRERFAVGGTYKGVASRDADLCVRFWNLWGGSNRCRSMMSQSARRSVYRDPQSLERVVVQLDRAVPFVDVPMVLTNEPELLGLPATALVAAFAALAAERGGCGADIAGAVAERGLMRLVRVDASDS